MSIVTVVHANKFDTPNFKDQGQWLAGGTLRNDSFAGGYGHSPTSQPSFQNKRGSSDTNGAMINGNYRYLNKGFSSVDYLVNGGLLDLGEADIQSTDVYSYEISIVSISTGEVMASGEGTFEMGSLDSISTVSDLASINSTFNSLGYIGTESFGNKYMVIGTLTSLFTNREASFSEQVAGVAIGTLQAQMTGAIGNAMAKGLGLSFANYAQAIGYFGFIGAVLGELAQMAVGLDNSFGFGGDVIGFSQDGSAMNSRAKSTYQGIRDMLPDFMKSETTFQDMLSAVENSDLSDVTSYGDKKTLNMYDPYTYDQVQVEQQYGEYNTFDFGDFNNPNKQADIDTLMSLDKQSQKSQKNTDATTDSGSGSSCNSGCESGCAGGGGDASDSGDGGCSSGCGGA